MNKLKKTVKNSLQNRQNITYFSRSNYQYKTLIGTNMEYIVYKSENNRSKSQQNDSDLGSDKSQSLHSPNEYQERRQSHDSRLSRRSLVGDDSSQGRIKQLIKNNQKKNSKIWLRQDSVVRVPKELRSKHESEMRDHEQNKINMSTHEKFLVQSTSRTKNISQTQNIEEQKQEQIVSRIIQNAQSQQNEDNSTLFGEHGQKIVNVEYTGLQQSRSDDQITPTERNRAGKIPDQADILIQNQNVQRSERASQHHQLNDFVSSKAELRVENTISKDNGTQEQNELAHVPTLEGNIKHEQKVTIPTLQAQGAHAFNQINMNSGRQPMDLQRQVSSSISSNSANTYKVEPETQIQCIDFKTRLNGKIRKQIKTENKELGGDCPVPNSMRISQSCRPNDLGIQGEDLAENYETIQSQNNKRKELTKKLDSTGIIEKAPSMELNTVGIKSKLNSQSKRGNEVRKSLQFSASKNAKEAPVVLNTDLESNGTIRADKANYAGTIEYQAKEQKQQVLVSLPHSGELSPSSGRQQYDSDHCQNNLNLNANYHPGSTKNSHAMLPSSGIGTDVPGWTGQQSPSVARIQHNINMRGEDEITQITRGHVESDGNAGEVVIAKQLNTPLNSHEQRNQTPQDQTRDSRNQIREPLVESHRIEEQKTGEQEIDLLEVNVRNLDANIMEEEIEKMNQERENQMEQSRTDRQAKLEVVNFSSTPTTQDKNQQIPEKSSKELIQIPFDKMDSRNEQTQSFIMINDTPHSTNYDHHNKNYMSSQTSRRDNPTGQSQTVHYSSEHVTDNQQPTNQDYMADHSIEGESQTGQSFVQLADSYEEAQKVVALLLVDILEKTQIEIEMKQFDVDDELDVPVDSSLVIANGETRNDLKFEGVRQFVNKTQQDMPSNWRNIEIEKIHEMGSADEQSKMLSSRNPNQDLDMGLSSQRTAKKDMSIKDVHMVASFGNIENNNDVPKESYEQSPILMVSRPKQPQYNDPFISQSSKRQRGWNLNSTDKPCVSIEANIDPNKLSTLNQSIMTTNRDETPDMVYKNKSHAGANLSNVSHKKQLNSPTSGQGSRNNKPNADSILSGRQTYITEDTRKEIDLSQKYQKSSPQYQSNQDQDFIQKFQQIRQSRDVINSKSVFDNPVPKINDNFDLMKFVSDNHLDGLYPNMSSVSQADTRKINRLAIHDFHSQNRSFKNQGPRDFSNHSQQRQFLAQSSIDGGPSYASNGSCNSRSPRPLYVDKVTPRIVKNRLLTFKRAISLGQIDIENSYSLIQYVKRAHGIPVLTDKNIAHIVDGSKILDFKHYEVIRFMQENPSFMGQIMQMNGVDELQKSKDHRQQFFDKRPRYTQKVLEKLYDGLPGLIGNLPYQQKYLGPSGDLFYQMDDKVGTNMRLQHRQQRQLDDHYFVQKEHKARSKQRSIAKLAHGSIHRSTSQSKIKKVKRHCMKSFDNTQGNIQIPSLHNKNRAAATNQNSDRRKVHKTSHSPIPRISARRSHNVHVNPSPVTNKNHETKYSHLSQNIERNTKKQHMRNYNPVLESETPSQSYGAQVQSGNTLGILKEQSRDHPSQKLLLQNAKLEAQQLNHNKILKKNYMQSHHENKRYNQVPPVQMPHNGVVQLPFMGAHNMPTKYLPKSQNMARNKRNVEHAEVFQQNLTGNHAQSRSKEEIRVENIEEDKTEYAGIQKTYSPRGDLPPNLQEKAMTTFEGTSQNPRNGTFLADPMLYEVDVKKPKTNQRAFRQGQKINQQVQMMNSSSAFKGFANDQISNNQREVESHANNISRKTPSLPYIAVQNEQRSELLSAGSNNQSFIQNNQRAEEVHKQKLYLENEEQELMIQRKAIQGEKDKINRQLKRLDHKQDLAQKEELVKKQRLILEIQKKKLREDIDELDNLKSMLQERKKDNDGFSELAQSNKEMKSLRSGDFNFRERSFYSGQSKRKTAGNPSFGVSGMRQNGTYESGGNITEGGLTTLQFPMNEVIVRDSGQDSQNTNHIVQSQHIEAPSSMGTNSKRKQTMETFVVQDEITIGENDLINAGKHTSSGQNQSSHERESAMEAYGNYHKDNRTGNSSLETNGDRRASVKSKTNTEVARNTDGRLSTPGNLSLQNSNMTFLSGCGVFDWAHSMLMDDVHHDKIKFGSPNRLDIFTEDEIFNLIDEFKTSQSVQKQMRDPEHLQIVYSKSLETLQELMSVMNQSLLFQMIAKKYLELTLDNTIKLLVRCKQLLQSRTLAYQTLKDIAKFENDTQEIRKEVDEYLEGSPRDDIQEKIQEIAQDRLAKETQQVIDNIAQLRDQYKLFSKMGATTSKGNQVLNVMAYKRRDAMRYLIREYEAIRRLIQVVDITIPQVQKK